VKARDTKRPRLFSLVAAAMAVSAILLTGCVTKLTDTDKTATAVSKPQPTVSTHLPTPTTINGIPTDVGKDDSAFINGAGATFPGPLYTRWFSDYASGIAPGVHVNYQAIGSGGGVQLITEQAVDFGASDAPMDDYELSQAPSSIQHIPTTLGAVVVTYNLDGVSQPLRFDGDTIAKIYLGTIKKWDDPAIASQNPGVTLPSASIVVVHRSDGSGTSYVFTDFLSSTNSDWKAGPGTSKNPQWPVGLGGQGNEGVTQQVKQNKNAIGYVELVYAQTNNLPVAQVKNKSGEFITPDANSTSLAASGVPIPADYRVSIVDSPTKGAYPISSFTYILLYRDQKDAVKGKVIADLLWWAIHDGQQATTELGYAPLPAEVVKMVEKTLTSDITAGGQPLLH
jgi:phosphate transport system substrate-binding protein